MAEEKSQPQSVLDKAIQAVLPSLIAALLGAVAGIFKKDAPKVVLPHPDAEPEDQKPVLDDFIPPPKKVQPERKVVKVRCKILRAQYNRKNHPEKYTKKNPMGLYPKALLQAIRAGAAPLLPMSKFWLDLTAYDAEGREFLGEDVVVHRLAFNAEHLIEQTEGELAGEVSQIIGRGQDPKTGGALPWHQEESSAIGFGITEWMKSYGFNMQCKPYGEGVFELSGAVGGVRSNTIKLVVADADTDEGEVEGGPHDVDPEPEK